MKKSFVKFFIPILAGLIFTGCASIPDPSEECSTLIYGNGEYNGTYEYAGTSKGETVTKYAGIKVIIKNLETNRKYTLISNGKGEFIKTGLPVGEYFIYEISTDFSYDGYRWTTTSRPNRDNPYAQISLTEGVVNIGKIYVDCNYSTGYQQASWGTDFYNVINFFYDNHPDSLWKTKRWITTNGEVQELN